jgi:hypothetical protein
MTESKKFQIFFRRRQKAILFLIGVTLLLYLPMLTNFSYSIDSERIISDSKGILWQWLSIDRFGLVVLKKIFLFGTNLNPYFINVLTYVLMAFSAILLLYIIDQLTQISSWIQVLAVTLYLVSPIHFEQNSFVLQSVEVMIGFNLMFSAMIVLGIPSRNPSLKRIVGGMLLLVASFSIYPSIIIGAATLAIVILHLYELEKPLLTFSGYFRRITQYAVSIFGSLLIYVLLNQVVKHINHVPKNTYIQSAWGHMDNSVIIKTAFIQFKQFFILPNHPFFLSMVTYLAIVAFIFVIGLGLTRKRIYWTILLDIIAEFVLAISLLIILGTSIGPIRSLTPTVPLVIMVYSITIMTCLQNKHLIFLTGICFLLFAFMQSKTTSDLEQSFIITYENEVKFSDQIINRIQELGINDFNKYKLVVIGEKKFNSPLTEMGEIIGNTHYNWDLVLPTANNRRVTTFMSSQGYDFLAVRPADYRKAQKMSPHMKVFPGKGSLKIKQNLIIVNLQSN